MKEKQSAREKLLDVTFEEVYRYGYCGAGTAAILNKAGVPKGSMYHHFGSKKGMVIAMIKERLIPKVRDFFDFRMRKEATAVEILEYTMRKIANNKMLVTHGCPLHRLMFEMDALDRDIAALCEAEFENLRANLAKVLHFGMKEGTIKEGDAEEIAGYVIASSWGFLSRPAEVSSREQFLKDSSFLLQSLKK
jgi:TetR/AcrR family transcriptional repressor of nem operon